MDNGTIQFRYETARFQLNCPTALRNLPMANLKKLFKMMFLHWDREENAEAICVTHTALNDYFSATKASWSEASVAYQNGYVDTKCSYCRNKRKAAADNAKLLSAVRSAKAAHERAKKLLASFQELQSKYEI